MSSQVDDHKKQASGRDLQVSTEYISRLSGVERQPQKEGCRRRPTGSPKRARAGKVERDMSIVSISVKPHLVYSPSSETFNPSSVSGGGVVGEMPKQWGGVPDSSSSTHTSEHQIALENLCGPCFSYRRRHLSRFVPLSSVCHRFCFLFGETAPSSALPLTAPSMEDVDVDVSAQAPASTSAAAGASFSISLGSTQLPQDTLVINLAVGGSCATCQVHEASSSALDLSLLADAIVERLRRSSRCVK